MKQHQNAGSSNSKEQLESNAPDNLILVSILLSLRKNAIYFTFFDKKKAQLVLIQF